MIRQFSTILEQVIDRESGDKVYTQVQITITNHGICIQRVAKSKPGIQSVDVYLDNGVLVAQIQEDYTQDSETPCIKG